MKIFSLDISSKSTGWCLLSITDNSYNLSFGKITIDGKYCQAKKLSEFKTKLNTLIKETNPDYVVIEEAYFRMNIKTLKILSEFIGVAKELCWSILEITPDIVNTTSVRSYFNIKGSDGKKRIYEFVVSLITPIPTHFTFNSYNDITDAVAQAVYFYDNEFNKEFFKKEKDYGYLYRELNYEQYKT